jgi:hypothetical protein
MASAEAKTVTVEKVITEEQEVVALELSIEEAQALRDILGYGIVGTGARSRLLDDLFYALSDTGVTTRTDMSDLDFEGRLVFK